MYRITDIWFTFEHLLSVAEPVIPRNSKLKLKPYNDDTLMIIGLSTVGSNFGQLMAQHVTAETMWRKELYLILAYFINNTEGGTKTALRECRAAIKEKRQLRFQDLLALGYGLRNLYVHEGMMAALGSKDYALKRRMYEIILDNLTLSSFILGSEYAQRVLSK